MSLVLFGLQSAAAAFRSRFINRAVLARCVSRSTASFDNEEANESEDVNESEDAPPAPVAEKIDPSKDRRVAVPVETSIRYLLSDAYKTTYGNDPVWKMYRRNFKGQFPPRKTRKTCIRGGLISTGSPCPICRDEYLVLDYRNTRLLNQFISEHNGAVLSYNKTNICRNQHQKLLIAVHRAKDYGTITFDVPFREYNYADWYKDYKPLKASETAATQETQK